MMLTATGRMALVMAIASVTHEVEQAVANITTARMDARMDLLDFIRFFSMNGSAG
jgi:hypothetical protein